MKMLPVLHKPIEVTQFFQDHGHSPHMCRPGCNWRSGVRVRSPEVKWGHNPFLPISRDRMEIETRKGAKRLRSSSRFGGWTYWPTWVVIWPWPDLTWGQIFNWTFQGKKVHVPSGLDMATTVTSFLFSYLIKKVINEIPFPWKMIIFSFDDLWSQNYWT